MVFQASGGQVSYRIRRMRDDVEGPQQLSGDNVVSVNVRGRRVIARASRRRASVGGAGGGTLDLNRGAGYDCPWGVGDDAGNRPGSALAENMYVSKQAGIN